MFTTNGTYPWSFVTQIFHSGQPSHGGDRTSFEVMTLKSDYIFLDDILTENNRKYLTLTTGFILILLQIQ